MIQSKELTQFYREYKAWLDNGAPHKEPFYRFDGLCCSIEESQVEDKCKCKCFEELSAQFIDSDLDHNYPFGKESFRARDNDNTQHLDPKRIKWVEDHLKPEFTGEEE